MSTEQREFSSEDIPDPTTYVSSLKMDELKAELNKRGLKRSGNKSVLIDQLRAAIQSQDHDEEPFERSSSNVDRDEHDTALSCANNKLTIEDLSSFIETKVKEVCCFEIENLKSEASASYANELVISLQKKNKDLQDKLQELESHHIILKQEANALHEENRSLLTAIRLMNNDLQNSNEEKCVPISSTNSHEQISESVKGVAPMHEKESPWVSVNNVKSKQREKRSKKAKFSKPDLTSSLPKLKGFKIAFVNIVSLPKYLDELRLRMQSQNLDILALSETRLDNTFTDSAVSIEGYTLLRRDRCRSGGGVAMYIHNVIEYKNQIRSL